MANDLAFWLIRNLVNLVNSKEHKEKYVSKFALIHLQITYAVLLSVIC